MLEKLLGTEVARNLFGEGGLARVRAILAFAFTGGGIAYVLAQQSVPPAEYNLLWSVAVTHYFSTRAVSDGNGS